MPDGLTSSEGRKFGLQVGVAFMAIGSLLWWRERVLLSALFIGAGGLLVAAGIAIPTRLGPIERGWMGFAQAISKVTTPVFMGITYYIVFAPIGIIMRLCGRNPMAHKATNGSYWVNRVDGEERRGDLTNQF